MFCLLVGSIIFSYNMAEKPEDLNLPNAVISRLAKDAVSIVNRGEGSLSVLPLQLLNKEGCNTV